MKQLKVTFINLFEIVSNTHLFHFSKGLSCALVLTHPLSGFVSPIKSHLSASSQARRFHSCLVLRPLIQRGLLRGGLSQSSPPLFQNTNGASTTRRSSSLHLLSSCPLLSFILVCCRSRLPPTSSDTLTPLLSSLFLLRPPRQTELKARGGNREGA